MHTLQLMAKETRNFGFRVTDELLAELDRVRRMEDDLPTRGEMLRRLVKRAASAEAKPKPPKEEARRVGRAGKLKRCK